MMNRKNKILITDTAPLYPPLWGGPKRIWELYSNFNQNLFDIKYVGIDVNLQGALKYHCRKISDNLLEIICALPPYYYLWHFLEQRVFKGMLLDLFLYLWTHTDWHFKYILNSLDTDIIICSHPWSSLSIRKKNKQIFIYDAHNCEYLLMKQILCKHWLKNPVLSAVRKIEAEACNKSDMVFVCSEKEKQEFIDLYKIREDKIIVISNGASAKEQIRPDTKNFLRQSLSLSVEDKLVVFIGAYYKPNIDAVKSIITNIAPQAQEFKFIVVGSASQFFRNKNIPDNVILFGRATADQLDMVLSCADIAINPMFNGSGINIKMLDYMSYGLPIVTTEWGARGIFTDGKQPFIICNIHQFVDYLRKIAADKYLYLQMSRHGRELIMQRYDWKKISALAEQKIINLIGQR